MKEGKMDMVNKPKIWLVILWGCFLIYGGYLLSSGFTELKLRKTWAEELTLPFKAPGAQDIASLYPPLPLQLDQKISGTNIIVEFDSQTPRCYFSVKDKSGQSHFITTTLLGGETTSPEINNHQIIYHRAGDNVDLEYLVYDGHLKENIYIQSPHSPHQFSFHYQLDPQAKLVPLPDGTIAVMDKNKDAHLFSIDKPMACDAQGKIIAYQILLEDDQLILKPEDPSQFKGAVYPLILDPSYTVKADTQAWATAYAGQRKLGRGSNGRLHCVYYYGSPYQVYYAYSDNAGQSWTEEAVTSATGSNHQYSPSMALDAADNVHVVWEGLGWGTNTTKRNVQYRKRTTSWQSQEAITDVNYDFQFSPAIALDSSDNVHVLWQGWGWDGYNLFNIQYKKRTGSGWQSQEAVTSVNYQQYDPAIALDSSDNVHVVWEGAGWGTYSTYNIIYRQRTGSGWQSQEEVVDVNYAQSNPVIALDSSDNVHVVWYGTGWGTNTTVSNIQYRKRTTSWQSQEAVTDKNAIQNLCSLALDSSDNVQVVWTGKGWGTNTTVSNIQYRKRTTSWQSQEGLTDEAYYQMYPNIIWAKHPTVSGVKPNIPASGYAFIWTSDDAGAEDVEYYYSSDLTWPSAAAAPVQIKGGTTIKGGVTIK